MKSAHDFLLTKAKQDFGVLKKWTNTKLMTDDEVNENIRNLVAHQIRRMIEDDFKKLLDLLYQTDLSEQKVRECFQADKSAHEVSLMLADLYLHRMLQKYQTRKDYSDENIQGDWE